MKIVIAYPPNYEEIKKAFNPPKTVVFTYGDTIYNPNNGLIGTDLMIHEGTHEIQQSLDPKKWWDRYLIDPQFRVDQEIEAYHNQYKYLKDMIKDRNQLFRHLHRLASDFSSPIYGGCISYQQAVERIKNG